MLVASFAAVERARTTGETVPLTYFEFATLSALWCFVRAGGTAGTTRVRKLTNTVVRQTHNGMRGPGARVRPEAGGPPQAGPQQLPVAGRGGEGRGITGSRELIWPCRWGLSLRCCPNRSARGGGRWPLSGATCFSDRPSVGAGRAPRSVVRISGKLDNKKKTRKKAPKTN